MKKQAIKTLQVKDGRQERPYANHVFKWKIETDGSKSEKEVLEYCQAQLKDAGKEKGEYYKLLRSNMSFENEMRMKCGGFYELKKIDENHYEYTVEEEYID